MYSKYFIEKPLNSIRKSIEFGFDLTVNFRVIYFEYNEERNTVQIKHISQRDNSVSFDHQLELDINASPFKKYEVSKCIKTRNIQEEKDPGKITNASSKRNEKYIRKYIIAKPIKNENKILGALLIDSNADMRDHIDATNEVRNIRGIITNLVDQFEICKTQHLI